MILPPEKEGGILVPIKQPDPDRIISDMYRWMYPGDPGYEKAKAKEGAELKENAQA